KHGIYYDVVLDNVFIHKNVASHVSALMQDEEFLSAIKTALVPTELDISYGARLRGLYLQYPDPSDKQSFERYSSGHRHRLERNRHSPDETIEDPPFLAYAQPHVVKEYYEKQARDKSK